MVTDPREGSDGDLPWICDFGTWPNENTWPHRASEQAKEKSPPPIESLRRHTEQSCLYDPPQLYEPRRSFTKTFWQPESMEVLNGPVAERLYVSSLSDCFFTP